MIARTLGTLIACCLLAACADASEPGGAGEPDTETAGTGPGTGSETGSQPVTTGPSATTTAGDDDDDDDDDDDSDSDSDNDDDDDSMSTGGPAACEGANRCVAAIPDPWLGPVARRVVDAADELPECGGAFEDTEPLSPYGGLEAAPPTCDCECVGNGVGCDGSARVRISNEQVFAGQSPCSASNGGPGGLLSVTVSDGVPQTYDEGAVPWDSGVHGVTVDMVDLESTGSCNAVPSESTPPASWTSRALICGAQTVDGTCGEDEVCVPDPALPYEGGVCIYRTGAWTCPDGYPNREIYHLDFEDNRDCSACSCGEVAGSCSGNASVGLSAYLGVGTSLPLDIDAPNNLCQSVSDGSFPCIVCTPPTSIAEITFDAGSFDLDDPSSPCPPSGGEPMGDAVAVEPVSVCCTD